MDPSQQMSLLEKEHHKLFWQFTSVAGGNLAAALLGAVNFSIMGRLLQPEGYGKLSLFLMLAGFLSLVLVNWPNAAIVRFGREELLATGSLGEVLWSRLLLYWAAIGVTLGIVTAFRHQIAVYTGIPNPLGMVWLLGIYVVATTLSETLLYSLQAAGHLFQYALFPVATRALALLLLVLTSLIAGGLDVEAVIIINVAAYAVATCTFVSSSARTLLHPLFSLSRKRLRQILNYSWSLIPGALATFTVGWVDLAVINAYMTKADVGTYSLAYQGMTYLQLLLIATTGVLYPLVTGYRVSHRVDAVLKYLRELIPLWTLLWSAVISLLLLTMPFVVPVLFGKAFAPSVPPAMILVASLSVIALGAAMSPVGSAFDLVPYGIAVNIFLTLLNVGGDLLLVPRWGAIGAAIATAGSFMIANALSIPILRYAPELRSHPVTSRVLLLTLPVWGVLFPMLLCDGWIRLPLSVFSFASTIWFIRRFLPLDHIEAIRLMDHVEMPGPLRLALHWTICFFAAPTPARNSV